MTDRPATWLVATALAALLWAARPLRAQDIVERRGSQPELIGDVSIIDDNGVTVRSSSGATQSIPWDRVRDVQLDHNDPALAQRLETAEQLWRARSRVERGDFALAEPLFDRLFEQYRGRTHETALVVAEGLLRCRLARMANESAVVPALEVVRLRRSGIETDSYAALPAVLDETSTVCTTLPPMWVDERAMRLLASELQTYDAGDDAVVRAVTERYRRAVRLQRGVSEDEAGEQSAHRPVEPDQDVVKLLTLIDKTMSDDPAHRRAARHQLEVNLASLDTWARAWVRCALGLSFIKEDDLDSRLQGLVQLLHLPASSQFRDQNYLAGLALDAAADTLEELGDMHGAESLRADLLTRYRGHPVLRRESRYAQRDQ